MQHYHPILFWLNVLSVSLIAANLYVLIFQFKRRYARNFVITSLLVGLAARLVALYITNVLMQSNGFA